MKNVIFTGNVNSFSFYDGEEFNNWKEINIKYIKKYCKFIKADFLEINDSNIKYNALLEIGKRVLKTQYSAFGWWIGTLSSIVALYEFIESDYDTMIWLDSDLCFYQFNANLFKIDKQGIEVAHLKTVSSSDIDESKYNSWDYRKLLALKYQSDANLDKKDVFSLCSTGFFTMDKKTAIAFIREIEQNEYGRIFAEHFWEDTLKLFLDYNYAICHDEYIFENYINFRKDTSIEIRNICDRVKAIGWVDYLKCRNDQLNDLSLIHFAGSDKKHIKHFYDNESKVSTW